MTMWERLAMDAIVDCIIREIFPEEARDMCLILKWWLISLILSKPFPGVRGKNGVRFREILAMPFLLITCLKKWLKIQCFICHIKISSWEKSHKKSCNYITEREKFGKLECFRRSNGERDSVHERKIRSIFLSPFLLEGTTCLNHILIITESPIICSFSLVVPHFCDILVNLASWNKHTARPTGTLEWDIMLTNQNHLFHICYSNKIQMKASHLWWNYN